MFKRKETLCYSDYIKYGIRKSFYIFGLDIHDESLDTFSCPRCKEVKNKGIEHGHLYICPKCKLWMEVWGNALDIWEK